MQHIPKVVGFPSIPKELPKDLFNKLLYAEEAGGEIHKLYDRSHMALGGLVPVAFLSGEGSIMTRICDVGIALVVPFHSHVGLCGVITDYVHPNYRVPARYALLGASAVTALGLLKLSIFGSGITDNVRSLWKADRPPPKAPKPAPPHKK